ncbi:MAG: DUF1579 domain-containing protein [Steroidobacteraceae bacterium]
MRTFSLAFALCLAFAAIGSPAPVHASPDAAKPTDFNFLLGEWRVQHKYVRVSGERREWVDGDGTCTNRHILDGWGNTDDCVITTPNATNRALALRSYDAKAKEWAIWWLDGRYPSGPLDPPVKGNFSNDVGTFYGQLTVNGKVNRLRFIWSQITPTSARWEQALSQDEGKTWETVWIMNFTRIS